MLVVVIITVKDLAISFSAIPSDEEKAPELGIYEI